MRLCVLLQAESFFKLQLLSGMKNNLGLASASSSMMSHAFALDRHEAMQFFRSSARAQRERHEWSLICGRQECINHKS